MKARFALYRAVTYQIRASKSSDEENKRILFENAETHFNRAIFLLKDYRSEKQMKGKKLSLDDEMLLSYMLQLHSKSLLEINKTAKAEHQCLEALKIVAKHKGQNSKHLIPILQLLALIYSQGDKQHKEALQILYHAYYIASHNKNDLDSMRVKQMNTLTSNNTSKNNDSSQYDLFDEQGVIDPIQQNSDSDESSEQDKSEQINFNIIGTVTQQISQVYELLQDYENVLKWSRNSLLMAQKSLGSQHEQCMYLQSSIIASLFYLGKYQQAIEEGIQYLENYSSQAQNTNNKKNSNEKAAALCAIKFNIAQALTKLKQYQDALKMLDDCISLAKLIKGQSTLANKAFNNANIPLYLIEQEQKKIELILGKNEDKNKSI